MSLLRILKKKITDDALNNSSAKYFPEHTVLIAMYGANVGQLGWLKKRATVNQAVCGLIIDDSKANWRYVFYSLLQNRDDLIVQARGAAQQNLNQDLIKNFEIVILELESQRMVGSILAAYDDLIENNTKRIKIFGTNRAGDLSGVVCKTNQQRRITERMGSVYFGRTFNRTGKWE